MVSPSSLSLTLFDLCAHDNPTNSLPEYHNRTITNLAAGNRLYGCYALAVSIFTLGLLRDYLYTTALESQPVLTLLTTLPSRALAVALFAGGNTLVLSSMYALGVTGTYLGDYFGILMDERVIGFPFSVTDAPMYWGSTASFLGTAIWYGRPAGVVLTVLVAAAYKVALGFEDPFTAEIYRKRDEGKKKA